MSRKKKDSISKSNMRIFYLYRKEDVSGLSGTGIVAQGCEFATGTVALVWLTAYSTITIFPNMKELIALHGHDGKTEVRYYE